MKSRTLKRTICALSLLAALAAACLPPRGAASARGAQAANEIAVIVNKSNPVEDLPLSELREYFLAEPGHWPNARAGVRTRGLPRPAKSSNVTLSNSRPHSRYESPLITFRLRDAAARRRGRRGARARAFPLGRARSALARARLVIPAGRQRAG